MKVHIDYRAATLLKEAATETNYFKTLGKQVAGTAALGLFFFSRILDNCQETIYYLGENRKIDTIYSLYRTAADVVVLAAFTFAHILTCVTALFWQAHRMHSYLETEKLEIQSPDLINRLTSTLEQANAELEARGKKIEQLQHALKDPDIAKLLELKEHFNSCDITDKLRIGVKSVVDVIIKAIKENRPESPFTELYNRALNTALENDTEGWQDFLNTIRAKWD